MKKTHLWKLLPLLLGSFLLTACGSAVAAGSWPGITVDEANNVAYVAYEQYVYAVNLDNGTQAWRFPEEPIRGFTTFAAPEINGDQIVVGGYDHVLYGVNANNGTQMWSFAGSENRFIGPALAEGDKVLAPNADHKVYALNGSGVEQWAFATGEPVWSQPVTDGEAIYVAGMDKKLYAVDPSNGSELWSVDTGGTMVDSPVFGDDGLLYVSTLDHAVVAVDTQHHDLAWSFTTQDWVWGKPALYDGTLYAADLAGIVYAIDPTSGRELWRVETGSTITGTPTLFNDEIYVVNEAGQMFAISLDGRARQVVLPNSYEGALYGSPVPAGDILLIGLTDVNNPLMAMDTEGRLLWSFSPAE